MKLPQLLRHPFVMGLLICLGLGGLLAWFSGLPLWGASLIVAAAIFVNGLIAQVEDDAPGGFNNPQGGDASATDVEEGGR